MVNNIIDGISIKINSIFGSEYNIYTNHVVQNLITPAFLINIIDPESENLLGGRKKRVLPFDIIYFPEEAGNSFEMIDTGERLMQGMEFIVLLDGSMFRGTDMKYEIIDEVLHFYVNYNCTTIDKKTDEPFMESLTIQSGRKNKD